MTSNVTLKIETKLVGTLFGKINWSSLFKESNGQINAFVKSFFDSLATTAQEVGGVGEDKKYLVFRP